jgi:hypothetical protein
VHFFKEILAHFSIPNFVFISPPLPSFWSGCLLSLVPLPPCPFLILFPIGPAGSHISNRFLACGLLIALMMEAESTSETSVNLYENTRRDNPEDGDHQFM